MKGRPLNRFVDTRGNARFLSAGGWEGGRLSQLRNLLLKTEHPPCRIRSATCQARHPFSTGAFSTETHTWCEPNLEIARTSEGRGTVAPETPCRAWCP